MGILQCIGNTPIAGIDLNPNPGVKLFAKLEGSNPGGSVKDRIAMYMVEAAEKNGQLTRDKIILEATSGNTGIALAFVAAAKGYKLILTMPESMSLERRTLLALLGAKLVLTPATEGMKGAIKRAEDLNKELADSWIPQQFNNVFTFTDYLKKTGLWKVQRFSGEKRRYFNESNTTGKRFRYGFILKKRSGSCEITV